MESESTSSSSTVQDADKDSKEDPEYVSSALRVEEQSTETRHETNDHQKTSTTPEEDVQMNPKAGDEEADTIKAAVLLANIKLANQLINGEMDEISKSIEKIQIRPSSRGKEGTDTDGRPSNSEDNISSNGPSASPLTNSINQHETENNNINYISYVSEQQMPSIMKLIQKDLSEPYSIYTYRYFIHNWPKLCFLAIDTSQNDEVVGAIVCKLDVHKQSNRRGYIAMLAVDEGYRRKKIGSSLVLRSIRAMAVEDADEIVLETEITNKSALRLYENLGFVRDKRLFRYYLNGVDALRLKLWLK